MSEKYNEWLELQGGEVQNAPPEIDIEQIKKEKEQAAKEAKQARAAQDHAKNVWIKFLLLQTQNPRNEPVWTFKNFIW